MSGPQPTTILRPLLIAAALVIILGAVRIAAPVLNPLLIALVITLLCNPIYLWLQRRAMPSWLALLIMVAILLVGAVTLGSFIGVSLSRLTAQLSFYQSLLSEQERALRAWLAEYGIVASDLQFFGLLDSVSLTRFLGAVAAAMGNVLGNTLVVLVLVLFFLVELPSFRRRLSSGLGQQNPLLLARLTTFSASVVGYFGVRTYINLVVAAGSTVGMFALQVPFAALWGLLIFVLSYIPYIGIPIALLPTSLVTLAEQGIWRTVAVVAIVTVINLGFENLVAPSLIGRRLSLAPAVVFVSFFFWTWLLGPPGTFLSMPITVLVTALLESYDETRWLAQLIGSSPPQPPSPRDAAWETGGRAERQAE